jgi:hypothetical protein
MTKLFVKTFDQDLDCNETITKTCDQDQDSRLPQQVTFHLGCDLHLSHILITYRTHLGHIYGHISFSFSISN